MSEDTVNWPKGRLILAYLLKEAKVVDGRTKLNKLMAFLKLERDVDIGYKIIDGPYGVIPNAMGKDIDYLLNMGYEKVEKTPVYNYSKENFESTEKLNALDIPISEDVKRKVRSILRKYMLLSNTELTNYSHERYSPEKYQGLRKVDVAEEVEKKREKDWQMYVNKAKGDERKALELWAKKYDD